MGLVLYAIYAWLDTADGSPYEIRLSSADVDRIERQLGLQLKRTPSDSELQRAISRHIQDEALYREALELGLHVSDEIVRRRLVQIMRFLQEDNSSTHPGENELREYYNSNLDDYRLPARLTLRHLFFSVDRRSDARADATAALSRLQSGSTETSIPGDPFIAANQLTEVSTTALEREFGSEFAANVTHAGVGQWHGPITSAFGYHLVFVDEVQAERLQAIDEVRSQLTERWRQDKRDQISRDSIRHLTTKYEVTVAGEPWSHAQQ